MLDVLNFIFSSVWTFLGTLMLIYSIGAALAMPASVIKRQTFNIKNDGGQE